MQLQKFLSNHSITKILSNLSLKRKCCHVEDSLSPTLPEVVICIEINPCMRPANERRRHIVASCLIGWHIHKVTPACTTPNGVNNDFFVTMTIFPFRCSITNMDLLQKYKTDHKLHIFQTRWFRDYGIRSGMVQIWSRVFVPNLALTIPPNSLQLNCWLYVQIGCINIIMPKGAKPDMDK